MATCKVSIKGCLGRFIYCGIVAACVSLIVAGISLATPIVDGPVAREKLKHDVTDLLYQQKFNELEKLAKHLRATKERFPEGHWKLMYFYAALCEPPRKIGVQRQKSNWDRHFALLEKWQNAYPRSVTAKVVIAKVWMNYGWEVRGSGFASTVTQEGWRLLGERMKQAVAQLQSIPLNSKDDNPERFNTLLELGKTEEWPREKFMTLFDAAVAFEPQYHPCYAAVIDYLTPRWHGEGNEWLEFIEKVDAISGDPGGRELYARMAIGWWGQEWTNFDDHGVSWSKVKKGFRDMEKRFPDSPYNLNNFAKYACIAGDMEVARDLFMKIDNAPYLEVWQKPFNLYDDCRNAAGVGGPIRGDLKENQEKLQARILADQGDKYSQYWVAAIESDTDKGMALLKDSAKQGFAPAQAELGRRYWNSKKDRTERTYALEWMEKAALQDDDVKFELPQMLEYEEGPDRNLIKAYAWYANNNNSKNARDAIERLSKILSPNQLVEARKEAERIHNVIQAIP